ncbi:MAG: ribosome silencing factor [Gammaproteobacteria bacterium]|nr:ribosome silencing factor [Gammaproteobacteria bacterium]
MNKFTRQISAAMEDLKAEDVQTFDVRTLTTMTDFMIIASGRSDRQVKAIAEKVIEMAKSRQIRPLGVEGQQQGEWILIDFGDVIVHVMRPATRVYYQLEKLWSVSDRAGAGSHS